jgi:N-acetylneuraminic acid mutarotase
VTSSAIRRRGNWALFAVLAGLLLALAPPVTTASAASVTLMVSAHPDRSSAQLLTAAPESGLLYIFTTPDAGVATVSFWLDNPGRTGAPLHVESWAPFTFLGDTAAGSNPWDSRSVANGQHTITAVVVAGGQTQVVTAAFMVNNAVPPPPQPSSYVLQVSTHTDRSASAALAGATLTGPVYVSVPAGSSVTRVTFFLDDPTRAKSPYQVEGSAPWDFRGTATAGANPWQTTAVANGTHVISADVTTTTGVSHIDAAFTVTNGTAPPPAPGTGYTFAPISSLPTGTTEAESVVVGDKVYLFGGFDVHIACCTPTNRAWVYDVAGNTWSGLPPMPGVGISHAGIDSDGTRYIYYAGGYADDPAGIQGVNATALVWRYDIVTETYTALPSLPSPRTAGGMAYVSGKLYYFGGNGLDRTLDSSDTWMLDVANGATSWVSLAAMPNARDHVGFAVIGGQIYAVGGEHSTDSSTAQADLDRYDPVANTWTVLAPMPFARSHLMDSTFVSGGKLFTAGGWTTSVVSAAVIAYDPATNTWETMASLPEARTSATAKSVSGGRYVYCCGSSGTSTSTGWMATPSN